MAVLIALALPALAEESKRGFFEGDLAGGGKIVFFVQGNHAVSAYFFDVSGKQTGFAGGGAGPVGCYTGEFGGGMPQRRAAEAAVAA